MFEISCSPELSARPDIDAAPQLQAMARLILVLSSLASVGALTVPTIGRRAVFQRAAAAAFGAASALPLAAQAAQGVTKAEYDAAASTTSSAFEDVEKIRAERKIRIAAGRKEFDSLMLKLDKTESSAEFVDACNALSVYLVGKGETPEELNIKRTIGRVKEKYTEFNDPCADRLCTRGTLDKKAEDAYASFIAQVGVPSFEPPQPTQMPARVLIVANAPCGAQLRKTAPKQESIGSGSNGATRGF